MQHLVKSQMQLPCNSDCLLPNLFFHSQLVQNALSRNRQTAILRDVALHSLAIKSTFQNSKNHKCLSKRQKNEW